MLPSGQGRLLEIDLTAQRIAARELPEALARRSRESGERFALVKCL